MKYKFTEEGEYIQISSVHSKVVLQSIPESELFNSERKILLENTDSEKINEILMERANYLKNKVDELVFIANTFKKK